MALFHNKKGKLAQVSEKKIALERDLQALTEAIAKGTVPQGDRPLLANEIAGNSAVGIRYSFI